MSDTSKREELIEAAEVAIREAWAHRSQNPSVQTGPAECAAIAAFAVFEKAHAPTAPTDDEREALRSALHQRVGVYYSHEEHEAVLDVVFDLGFRRTAVQEPSAEVPEADADPDTAFELGRIAGYDEAMREPQPEPSDAQVEAACRAYARAQGPMFAYGTAVVGAMRAALRAAAGIGQEEKR